MPKVGDKHFPYTKAGYAAAAEAKKGRGYNKGGPVEKKKKRRKKEEEKKELAPKFTPEPSPEENRRKVESGNWEGKVEGEVENFRQGGLARSRRNHRGCGAVMEGRRKKTLYT
jgi:hypothetical protein